MPDVHALLAPSAAHRWMTCAPSARLESQMPDKGDTDFAAEGTIAHAVAEHYLKQYRDNKVLACYDTDTVLEFLKDDLGWDDKLRALADRADAKGFNFNEIVETVHEHYVIPVYNKFLEEGPGAELLVEAQLKLEAFIPGGFGSADAVIISGDTMYVYDFKYGKGVKVSAKGNPQMRCYALGALCGPGELRDIKCVVMNIVQPRIHHFSADTIDAEDLYRWGTDVLRPAAEKAWEGRGEYVPGEHCRFCNAAPRCRALKDAAISTVTRYQDISQLSNEELSEALKQLPMVNLWAKNIESEALDLMLAGNPIPDFKVVAGRSLRSISDPTAAAERLSNAGFAEDTYLKPRELRNITDLERILRKKGFQELLGDLVVKPQGKPTLAPADDPREEYVRNIEQDFKNI